MEVTINELCREALESKSFTVSRTRKKYMECAFSDRRQRSKELVTILGE